jgi:hypothetical protein
MFVPKKHMLSVLTILMVVALTGCNMGQAAQPTPTAIDLDAVKTSAAATAFVELTQIASAAPPNFTATAAPSDTPSVSETPGGPATNTPAAGGLTPSETPLVGGGTPFDLTATAIPSLTPLTVGGGSGGGPVCKNSQYGGDVSIPDGTVMKPWQKFVKIWKVRNTGTCTWDQGFSFRAWSGPPSMGTSSKIVPYTIGNDKTDWIAPGAAVDIGIDMYAPGDPGDYVAHWAMYDDNGKQFGGDFTVAITVKK